MSQPEKVSEILNSLHEHIEEQKKLLDEENKELLEKGKINFKAALANEQLTIRQRKNTFPNASRKTRLIVRHTLMKFIYRVTRITEFLRVFCQNSKQWLRNVINNLVNVAKRKHR